MGLGILKAGTEQTCKKNGESKRYDYLLVSTDLIPYIGDVKIEADVPWCPHTAVSFFVDRRPGQISH